MQVRGRLKSKVALQSRPLTTLLVLALPVLFIFLSSVMFGRDKNLPTGSVHSVTSINKSLAMESSKHPAEDRPVIIYEFVAETPSSVLRYAAYTEGNAFGSIKKPLMIRRWVELMIHQDTEYASELARNLSKILQAC
jgi:hypothetical protein